MPSIFSSMKFCPLALLPDKLFCILTPLKDRFFVICESKTFRHTILNGELKVASKTRPILQARYADKLANESSNIVIPIDMGGGGQG